MLNQPPSGSGTIPASRIRRTLQQLGGSQPALWATSSATADGSRWVIAPSTVSIVTPSSVSFSQSISAIVSSLPSSSPFHSRA